METNFLPGFETRPLAERLRPERLESIAGVEGLMKRVGPFLAMERMPSLLLFGPPGCGKSTLACAMARRKGRKWVRLSAPQVSAELLRKEMNGGLQILVLDEIHRLSKAQQDFFLPYMESGLLTVVASTTENPSCTVTPQLLSRFSVVEMRPIGREDVAEILRRGARMLGKEFPEETLAFLAEVSRGDARAALNLLEQAAVLPFLNVESVRSALPDLPVRHDRNGESHYNLISAMIKSIRGSDVDAALYWMAALIAGGEDPLYICRRLVISASEDIGLADPNALSVAVAAMQAVERVGMPEGRIPMAEACCYLALAKKSNSAYAAMDAALAHIKKNGVAPVPMRLRNACSALDRERGCGKGYDYPHSHDESWSDMDYMPDGMARTRFFHPRRNGAESALARWQQGRPWTAKRSG